MQGQQALGERRGKAAPCVQASRLSRAARYLSVKSLLSTVENESAVFTPFACGLTVADTRRNVSPEARAPVPGQARQGEPR